METSPLDAVKLYIELYERFSAELNEWDAFFIINAFRKSGMFDATIINALTERFSENERVTGTYAWLIFDQFIKGKDKENLLYNQGHIGKMAEIVAQKDLQDDSSFPCPLTIAIFKLVDAHSEGIFHAKEIVFWLEKLDPGLLSQKVQTISTPQGDKEIASDAEKYYALFSKALLKTSEYDRCKSVAQKALETISSFHYNNDLWFKMRIAICEEKSGDLEKSETLFQEILSTKAGSDKWFLYRDIADLYYEQKSYDKAWKYAVDAAHYGNEPHFLINLYLLQARILFKRGKSEQGKLLANLIAAILKEQGWTIKPAFKKLFEFYQLDVTEIKDVKTYHQQAKLFWKTERYSGKQVNSGSIIFIHRNGKFGKIKTTDNLIFNFHKRDVLKRPRYLEELLQAKVEFVEMKSYDGSRQAEQIKILSLAPLDSKKDTYSATITNIVEYGIFFKVDRDRSGLLHRNAMPPALKNSFSDEFAVGEKVKVIINRVTDKGLELILAE